MPSDRMFGEIGRWLIISDHRGPGWLLFPPDSCDHHGPIEHHPTFDAARLAFIDHTTTDREEKP